MIRSGSVERISYLVAEMLRVPIALITRADHSTAEGPQSGPASLDVLHLGVFVRQTFERLAGDLLDPSDSEPQPQTVHTPALERDRRIATHRR
jgi:hypothetical protein